MTDSTSPPLVSIRNLAKNFGKVRAVRDANMTIHRGQIYALLGRNGAGKTTTWPAEACSSFALYSWLSTGGAKPRGA